MRAFFSISVGFIYIVNNSFAQGSWTRRADFPELRYRAAAFSIGNKGYVGTGLTPTRRINDFWEYDPVSDLWQEKDSLPASGRESAVGFNVDGKGYIGGGVTDTFTLYHDFWEYDPQTDNWTRKANIPITLAFQGTLVAFSINGKGYVQASFNTDNFWEYDPASDSWTKKAVFPGGDLLGHVAFAIGLKGYIGTGFGSSENMPEFWEYNPSDNQWIQKANFPGSPRNGAVGFTIGGKGYIGLGNAGGTFPQDFWAYHTLDDSWTQIDSCGYGAEGAFAFTIGSKGYVGTGVFAPVGEFWEYDPSITSLHYFAANPIQNFLLRQNHPNPFNPSTTISFTLPSRSFVSLKVFDVIGREVATIVSEELSAGNYSRQWNAMNMPSGVYFYRLQAGNYSETKKLMVLK